MAFPRFSPGQDGKPLTVRVTFGAGPDGLLARLAEVAQALRAPSDSRDVRRLVNKVETESPSSVLVYAIVLDSMSPEQVQQELLALVPPAPEASDTMEAARQKHVICTMVNGVCAACGVAE